MGFKQVAFKATEKKVQKPPGPLAAVAAAVTATISNVGAVVASAYHSISGSSAAMLNTLGRRFSTAGSRFRTTQNPNGTAAGFSTQELSPGVVTDPNRPSTAVATGRLWRDGSSNLGTATAAAFAALFRSGRPGSPSGGSGAGGGLGDSLGSPGAASAGGGDGKYKGSRLGRSGDRPSSSSSSTSSGRVKTPFLGGFRKSRFQQDRPGTGSLGQSGGSSIYHTSERPEGSLIGPEDSTITVEGGEVLNLEGAYDSDVVDYSAIEGDADAGGGGDSVGYSPGSSGNYTASWRSSMQRGSQLGPVAEGVEGRLGQQQLEAVGEHERMTAAAAAAAAAAVRASSVSSTSTAVRQSSSLIWPSSSSSASAAVVVAGVATAALAAAVVYGAAPVAEGQEVMKAADDFVINTTLTTTAAAGGSTGRTCGTVGTTGSTGSMVAGQTTLDRQPSAAESVSSHGSHSSSSSSSSSSSDDDDDGCDPAADELKINVGQEAKVHYQQQQQLAMAADEQQKEKHHHHHHHHHQYHKHKKEKKPSWFMTNLRGNGRCVDPLMLLISLLVSATALAAGAISAQARGTAFDFYSAKGLLEVRLKNKGGGGSGDTGGSVWILVACL